MLKKLLITFAAITVVGATLCFVYRGKIREAILESQKSNLPEAVSYAQAKKKMTFINGEIEMMEIISVEGDLKMNKSEPPLTPPLKGGEGEDASLQEQGDLPESFNLAIPFTSQAPFAVWDEIHKETCEEASVLMAVRFVLGEDIKSANDAEGAILKIVDWEKINFGFWKDTDALKTAEILQNYFGLKNVEVKYDPSIEDIKIAIASGNPVIVPAAGRELYNPYYTPPGPYYHMLVVKGYTKDGVITNDPGTKRGADFIYKNDIFYNALHDWNDGDVLSGRKVMIVVKK
ncbi:C39 family peptidase [Candidatus Parcubacteria bacterium]|nr:C39 family peptidase [Patescibacteria group bacterium]MCG2694272.1 C39 family peptidase [Candidatus Parcubacteria bacterium]